MIEPPNNGPPHPAVLIKLIRKLVARGDWWFKEHADEREEERDIDDDDVLKVIELGDIEGDIVRGDHPGEWKCCVVGRPLWAERDVGVVTVVVRDQEVLIITVEWMDP